MINAIIGAAVIVACGLILAAIILAGPLERLRGGLVEISISLDRVAVALQPRKIHSE